MIKTKVSHLKRDRLLAVTKHPYFAFLAFGAAMMILMFLSSIGILQYSFAASLTFTLIYSMVAVGFSYLLGYAGLASLGTAGFVGLGAYIASFMMQTGVQQGIIPFEIPYVFILIIALLVSVGLGVVVGFISLRIEGIFLAIVTLGLSEVLYQLFLNWIPITGGPNGMTVLRFPVIFGDLRLDRLSMMLIVAAFMTLLLILTYNLGKSQTGRAMLAMKNSTSAAQAMGISLLKYRLLAFVLATAYAGLAGALLMGFSRYTDPYSWTLMFSLQILAACIFGGTRSLFGIIFGTFIVLGIVPMFLQNVEYLRNNSWLFNVIIGVVLILIVLFYRGGVMQLFRDIRKFFTSIRRRLWVRKYGND